MEQSLLLPFLAAAVFTRMNEFASEENWAMVFLCTNSSNHLSGTSYFRRLHFQIEYFTYNSLKHSSKTIMDTMHDANFPEIFVSKLSLLTVFVCVFGQQCNFQTSNHSPGR